MTSTAVARVNTETGEMTHFDLSGYLTGLDRGLSTQHQLAAAYDRAVADLVGPNDVQVEGARTFKKKSAWRKLARHFHISTKVVEVEKEYLGTLPEVFVATVTVRATAPWGQEAEAVGACSQDEATGRREITIADAIATAETRATNRAVSNLIAMGEVSAEEIGKRAPLEARNPARPPAPSQGKSGSRGSAVMPFGKSKGTPLAELTDKDILGALDWAVSKGKFEDFQADAREEMKRRGNGGNGTLLTDPPELGGRGEPPPLDQPPPGLEPEEDDLPF